jgi:hypothetical protein
MADHAYWRRTIAALDPESGAVVTYELGEGVRQWTGRIASLDSAAGLLVEVRGETLRLCPWSAVRAIESNGKREAASAAGRDS